MNTFRSFCVALAVAFLPVAAVAAPAPGFGQPFLVMDGKDTSGALLNFFQQGAPSDLYDLELQGTVDHQVGAPSLADQKFIFSSSQAAGTFALTLGTTTVDTTYIDLDPFQSGPGDLNISLDIVPPVSAVPAFGQFFFTYLEDFRDFKGQYGYSPEFEVKISVFLDGDLPTKVFGTGPNAIKYAEGPFGIDRIEFSTAGGGSPLPLLAPVPLPAGLPLLLVGLGALGMRRRAGARAN